MHLTIKERVELVLMSGADGVCYYYLNCFICFGALFMAHPVLSFMTLKIMFDLSAEAFKLLGLTRYVGLKLNY